MHDVSMKQIFRGAFFLAIASFGLHISLYRGYEALEGFLPVYVYATLGDVFYTFVGVLIATIFCGARLFRAPRLREYALLALIGLLIALFVEVKAQFLGRWQYSDAMPLIYGLGLSPLLQMTVLLPLSVFISTAIARHFRSDAV